MPNGLVTSAPPPEENHDESDESNQGLSGTQSESDDGFAEADGRDTERRAEDGQLEENDNGHPVAPSAAQSQAEDLPDEEPSFEDLLRRQGHGPLNVPVDLANDQESAFRVKLDEETRRSDQSSGLPVPSANSLGSVLSQALRTNDAPLLESCLQVSSLPSIRATIERLPSHQASNLLQKLADRMHRRPGRAGSLMVWVQWTLVAHGGYLATQPVAMRSLQALYRVVKQRASGLQPLLALKGKLDMLEAQLQLRRSRMRSTEEVDGASQQRVIYVEGEERSSDDEEEVEQDNDLAMVNGVEDSDGIEEDDVAGDSPDSSDEDADSLVDDEAASTETDSDEVSSEGEIVFDDEHNGERDYGTQVPDSEDEQEVEGASARQRIRSHAKGSS